MAEGKKISQQDQAAALVNANELAIVQSGKTKRVPLRDPTGTVADFWAFMNPCGIECATLTIPFASVRLLNTTALTIVAAPGAGLAIEVMAATKEIQFNAVAYATFTSMILQTATATTTNGQAQNVITDTASRITKFILQAATGTAATQIIANQALTVTVVGGDPTAGDSTIIVRVAYKIISV